MRISPVLLLWLPLSLAPGVLGAQVRIVGRVLDDLTDAPLAEVRVTLLDRDGVVLGRTSTPEDGTFEFQVRNAKAVRLRAERMGYQPNTSPLLYFDVRKFFQVEIRLDPEVILLAPLEVLAWSPRPENALHEGFRRRVQQGLGIYITREQILARNPSFISDMLREVPGLEVVASGYGTRPTVRFARAAGKLCAAQIWLDGFLINRGRMTPAGWSAPDIRLDDLVVPAAVEGIELYAGLATVPPEFLNADAECGVIAIWTRRGG